MRMRVVAALVVSLSFAAGGITQAGYIDTVLGDNSVA